MQKVEGFETAGEAVAGVTDKLYETIAPTLMKSLAESIAKNPMMKLLHPEDTAQMLFRLGIGLIVHAMIEPENPEAVAEVKAEILRLTGVEFDDVFSKLIEFKAEQAKTT